MTRILVTNQKGGVGKSTISANLAHYFATHRGKRTALLDFDSQASSSRWVKAVEAGTVENPVDVHQIALHRQPNSSFNRVLIELRRLMRGFSHSHEVVVADLTWYDALDSEFFFEFDIVIMPSAVSEVELITTIEFAQRHQWVFESQRYRPTLVLAPSRVRADQVSIVHRSSARFPFSFVLTPPILDSVDAKRAFSERFLFGHRNQKLSDSFVNFCRAIEQTMGIHFANQGQRPDRFDPKELGSPSLHSNLKQRVEIEKSLRNAPTEKTITQVGRPTAVPKAAPHQVVRDQAVVNGLPPVISTPASPPTAGRPSLSLVGRLFSAGSGKSGTTPGRPSDSSPSDQD